MIAKKRESVSSFIDEDIFEGINENMAQRLIELKNMLFHLKGEKLNKFVSYIFEHWGKKDERVLKMFKGIKKQNTHLLLMIGLFFEGPRLFLYNREF